MGEKKQERAEVFRSMFITTNISASAITEIC